MKVTFQGFYGKSATDPIQSHDKMCATRVGVQYVGNID